MPRNSDRKPASKNKYTCNDYRQEMILLALRSKLQRPDLSEEQRKRLLAEIATLEAEMDL